MLDPLLVGVLSPHCAYRLMGGKEKAGISVITAGGLTLGQRLTPGVHGCSLWLVQPGS